MGDEEELGEVDVAAEELEPKGRNSVIVENAGDDSEGGDFEHIRPPDRRLITQPYDLAIGDLVTQVDNRSLHLQPVYQRNYVWDNRKASKLVESLLINVPIPVCYLADESDGSRSVIDGQQRMRSLHRYLDNQFSLTGLEILRDLNRKPFHRLTERQQRLIRNRTIRCIVITEDSDPEIRFDVFERLNTGSVPLNAQELRNSVFRGDLNTMLHETAQESVFRRCMANRDDTRMAFEELILRFLALDERLTSYRPNLKQFLNDYMRTNRQISQDALAAKRGRFLNAAEKAYAVYGEECFRRAEDQGHEWRWRPTVNSAMFDAVMLNFVRLEVDPAELAEARDEIEQMTAMLTLDNDEFEDAISRATGDRTRLFTRVRIFSEELARLGFRSDITSEISG